MPGWEKPCTSNSTREFGVFLSFQRFNYSIESGINVGVTELCIITIGGYVYSRGYVNYFSHIFKGLRLFRTLE